MKLLTRLWILLVLGTLAACSPSPVPSSVSEFGSLPVANAEVESAKSTPSNAVGLDVGEDWPQWRGPRQDGISRETGLLAAWPEGGPPELWRVKMGMGYSSVVVAGERAYTMFGDEAGEYVICLRVSDGQTVWKATSSGPYKSNIGGGPRATPAVNGNRVYTVGATGSVLCLDARTGETIWRRNVLADYKGQNLRWGLSASPVVMDDLVFVLANGEKSSCVAALDRNTGDTIWTALDDGAGYSTPLIIELANKKQLVVFTGEAAVGIEPGDGRELWRYAWKTSYGVNAATPIFHNNRLFISSSYDSGSALLHLVVNNGRVRPKLLWASKKMKNHFSSSVLVDGYLYGFHDTILTCMDFESGEVMWTQRGFSKGSLLSADGKLIVYGEQAKLALAEVSPLAYKEISSAQVLAGKTWTVPALSRGRLFLRNNEELVCLDLNA